LTFLDILRRDSVGRSPVRASLQLIRLPRLGELRRGRFGLLLLTVRRDLPVLHLLKIYLTLARHFVSSFLAAEWEILVRKFLDVSVDFAHLGQTIG
jgi:hypothetical protein